MTCETSFILWGACSPRCKLQPLLSIVFFLISCYSFEKVYSRVVDPKHSEQSWNQSILWPVLVACSLYLRRMKAGEATFAPGEEELFSMTVAGPASSRAPYYADGVVRLANKSNTEICLLKTSKTTRAKVSFDHHKGMFALLSMLKWVANQYAMAEYTHLSSLELYFLHAHGNTKDWWLLTKRWFNVFYRWSCTCVVHVNATRKRFRDEQVPEDPYAKGLQSEGGWALAVYWVLLATFGKAIISFAQAFY